jgi:hypothetical protein
MSIIKCAKCGNQIELSEALKKEIEASVTADLDKKHSAEIDEIKKNALKEADFKSGDMLKKIKEESEADKKEMREQIKGLFNQIRELTKAKDNAEIDAEKRLLEKESTIRQEAEKNADEKQRLNLAAKEKTITDLQKALDDAQRKAAQGSQQLQGEVMELDFEKSLSEFFKDDEIEPVAKGVKGGDIRQTVKSPRGTVCGAMLWEIKRTKNWTDGWITKLKEDLRTAKANIPIIITEALPKEVNQDIAQFNGVWICKPNMAIILATLLRKSLLDAGYQKALAENRGSKADLLYGFVTSHEFVQQIEGMVETYKEMTAQVVKERTAFERLWAQREKQAQKLLLGTANIIGSMQGQIGQNSMPKIRGLELSADGEQDLLLLG